MFCCISNMLFPPGHVLFKAPLWCALQKIEAHKHSSLYTFAACVPLPLSHHVSPPTDPPRTHELSPPFRRFFPVVPHLRRNVWRTRVFFLVIFNYNECFGLVIRRLSSLFIYLSIHSISIFYEPFNYITAKVTGNWDEIPDNEDHIQ